MCSRKCRRYHHQSRDPPRRSSRRRNTPPPHHAGTASSSTRNQDTPSLPPAIQITHPPRHPSRPLLRPHAPSSLPGPPSHRPTPTSPPDCTKTPPAPPSQTPQRRPYGPPNAADSPARSSTTLSPSARPAGAYTLPPAEWRAGSCSRVRWVMDMDFGARERVSGHLWCLCESRVSFTSCCAYPWVAGIRARGVPAEFLKIPSSSRSTRFPCLVTQRHRPTSQPPSTASSTQQTPPHPPPHPRKSSPKSNPSSAHTAPASPSPSASPKTGPSSPSASHARSSSSVGSGSPMPGRNPPARPGPTSRSHRKPCSTRAWRSVGGFGSIGVPLARRVTLGGNPRNPTSFPYIRVSANRVPNARGQSTVQTSPSPEPRSPRRRKTSGSR